MCVSAQEELLSLKEKLEQKESEIKQLQEKLVLQGRDVDLNDKGKTKMINAAFVMLAGGLWEL